MNISRPFLFHPETVLQKYNFKRNSREKWKYQAILNQKVGKCKNVGKSKKSRVARTTDIEIVGCPGKWMSRNGDKHSNRLTRL